MKKTLKERLIDGDKDLIIAAKSDFWTFCLCMNEEFFSKRPYLFAVADAFQQVFTNYINNKATICIVNMPPRAGKSFITSHFCAFWLGHFNDKPIMRNTCTAELCKKLSLATRQLLDLPSYRLIFPGVSVDYSNRGWKSWRIIGSKRATSYFGAGVSGNIIGEGAALAITDDLYPSMDVAMSSAQNEAVLNWLKLSHHSRKEPFCAEIHIGTRWTKHDALGETLNFGVDILVKIPAILNEGTENEKSYCEAAMPLEQLQRERDRLGGRDSLGWKAEYMQEPIEQFGLLLPYDSLMKYKNGEQPFYVFRSIIIDPASRGGDFFCATECCLGTDMRIYVDRVLYNKRGIEANCYEITKWCTQNYVDFVQCESNGIGLAAVLQLRRLLPQNIKFNAFQSTMPKDIRITMGYEFVKGNFVFKMINRDDDMQYHLFMNEITNYSSESKNLVPHDDGIDCISTQSLFFKMLFASRKMAEIKEKMSLSANNQQ